MQSSDCEPGSKCVAKPPHGDAPIFKGLIMAQQAKTPQWLLLADGTGRATQTVPQEALVGKRARDEFKQELLDLREKTIKKVKTSLQSCLSEVTATVDDSIRASLRLYDLTHKDDNRNEQDLTSSSSGSAVGLISGSNV
jgi:hypothetical protein